MVDALAAAEVTRQSAFIHRQFFLLTVAECRSFVLAVRATDSCDGARDGSKLSTGSFFYCQSWNVDISCEAFRSLREADGSAARPPRSVPTIAALIVSA